MSFEVLSWPDDSLGQITRVGLEILCLSSVNPAFRPHVGPLLVPFPFFSPFAIASPSLFPSFGVGPRCKQFGVTLRNVALDSSFSFWSAYHRITVVLIWYPKGYYSLHAVNFWKKLAQIGFVCEVGYSSMKQLISLCSILNI